MPAPKRLWIVLRIVDYRVQALADLSNPCWEEISGDSIISDDRESMFQLARRFQGLLCSAEGLPSPRQATRFAAAMDSIRAALEGTDPEYSPDERKRPAVASGSGNELGLATASGGAEKQAGRSASELD